MVIQRSGHHPTCSIGWLENREERANGSTDLTCSDRSRNGGHGLHRLSSRAARSPRWAQGSRRRTCTGADRTGGPKEGLIMLSRAFHRFLWALTRFCSACVGWCDMGPTRTSQNDVRRRQPDEGTARRPRLHSFCGCPWTAATPDKESSHQDHNSNKQDPHTGGRLGRRSCLARPYTTCDGRGQEERSGRVLRSC